MKTSELKGAALDWAVAKCVYGDDIPAGFPAFSQDWAQGGPIIERERMDLNPHGIDSTNGKTHWRAAIQWLDESDFEVIGQTPLIAAMRCYVASKLGDEIEIPKELS